MRRLASQLEALGGVPFVLVTGFVAGSIQSMPRLLLGGASAPLKLVPFLIVGTTAVLWWVAALLLWWIALRRRSSILTLAAQVTLGLVIADVFAAALGMVVASIDTHGQFAAAMAQQLPTVISSNLAFTFLRSPLWFVGSALALSLGRHLNGQRPASGTPATTRPGAVI